MRKGGDLSRSIMMHEQWLQDGRTIGKLDGERRWLARQLALSGAVPGHGPAGAVADEAELAQLAEAWLSAAERVSAGTRQGARR